MGQTIALIWRESSESETFYSSKCTQPTLQTASLAIQFIAPTLEKKLSIQLARELLEQKGIFIVMEPEHTWEGLSKIVYKGVLPTADKIYDVAFIQTKPKMFCNPHEIQFYQSQTRKPISGFADVFLISHSNSQLVVIETLYDNDLFSLIFEHREQNSLSKIQKRSIQKQLLKAIYELHQKEIIHRDIKPQNCFIKTLSSGRISVALGDLSVATSLKQKIKDSSHVPLPPGSAPFLAPEYADLYNSRGEKVSEANSGLLHKRTSLKLDMWGLGLIFLLLENESLFHDIVPIKHPDRHPERPYIQTYQHYYRLGYIPQFEKPKDKLSVLYLIWEMLQPNPEVRISSANALKKKWNWI